MGLINTNLPKKPPEQRPEKASASQEDCARDLGAIKSQSDGGGCQDATWIQTSISHFHCSPTKSRDYPSPPRSLFHRHRHCHYWPSPSPGGGRAKRAACAGDQAASPSRAVAAPSCPSSPSLPQPTHHLPHTTVGHTQRGGPISHRTGERCCSPSWPPATPRPAAAPRSTAASSSSSPPRYTMPQALLHRHHRRHRPR